MTWNSMTPRRSSARAASSRAPWTFGGATANGDFRLFSPQLPNGSEEEEKESRVEESSRSESMEAM